MRSIFILCFIFMTAIAQGQPAVVIRGILLDSLTHEPIAFAHIARADRKTGTTSDIDGRFRIELPGTEDRLWISHLNYRTRSVEIGRLKPGAALYLQPAVRQLREVVVIAGENPAHRIIRQATRQKPLHDPLQLSSFRYQSFNKVVFKFEGPQLSMDSVRQRAAEKPLSRQDSAVLKLDSLRLRQHLLVTESVAEKFFQRPNRSSERVLDYQVSGFQTPLLAGLPNDYQPLGFYDDWVRILNRDYQSPLTRGSEKVYDFELRDTIFSGSDTVFIISFAPRPGKTADLLKGQISISTAGYAIKNIMAQTADPFAKTDFRVQQSYERVKDRWFPDQLNTELYFRENKSGHLFPAVLARSYLRDIVLEEPLAPSVFRTADVSLPSRRDTTWLHLFRTEERDPLEQRTFDWYDSINQKIKILRTVDRLSEGFFSNALKTGVIDWQLDRVFRYNRYEGVRLGAGLMTNQQLARWMQLGGYFAYGFSDRAWKYGGQLQFHLQAHADWTVGLRYYDDIAEPGVSQFFEGQRRVNNYVFRQWIGSRFDRIVGAQLATERKWGRQWRGKLALQHQDITPQYEYVFQSNGEATSSFAVTEALAEVSFIGGLREMSWMGRRSVIGFRHPILAARIARAFPADGAGTFRYTRWEMFASQQWRLKRAGRLSLSLVSGLTQGAAPVPKLFFSPGNNETGYWTYHTFQTMGIYEFLNDRYGALFLKHNIGALYQTRFSKPELLLWQASGWGELRSPEAHQLFPFATMERGFHESGLALQNIIRWNYLDVGYLGFGAGVFYRWGAYRLPEASGNLAVKFTFGFTF